MEIVREKINAVAVLNLQGRLNIASAPDLETAFAELSKAGEKKILVDCRELEYISSAGLRVLLAAVKVQKKDLGIVALSALSANVKQVFEISGFTSIFPIYASKEDAIAAM